MIDQKIIDTALKEYNVTDAAIAKLKADYNPLKIKDINDKEAYDVVKEAWQDMKKLISGVEEKRVELKADSLAYGRVVDAEAKRITAELVPVRDHLLSWKKYVDDEKEKVKKEKEEAAMKLFQGRTDELAKYGKNIGFMEVKEMSEETYVEMLGQAKVEHQEAQDKMQREEEERLKEEKAAAQAQADEEARLKKEREDQEAKQEELDRKEAEQKEKADELEKKEEELKGKEEEKEEPEAPSKEVDGKEYRKWLADNGYVPGTNGFTIKETETEIFLYELVATFKK